MFGGIITVTHDGQTSHHYKHSSDVYEVPALIIKANKLVAEYDMDVHEAYEHMNKEGQYIDPDMSPDKRIFEKISGDIVDALLDGFGKNKSVMQHIELDFDKGMWTHNYNSLCFGEGAQTFFHEKLPDNLVPKQEQIQTMNMGM